MRAQLDNQCVLRIRREILQPVAEFEGIQAWMVGGCVRDLMHHEGINDIDVICTDASKFVNALDGYFTENNIGHSIHSMANGHATVISVKTKPIFGEFLILPPQFDIEVSQLDHLDKLTPDEAIKYDAGSRDFICNAWYISVSGIDKPFTPLTNESIVYDAIGKYIHPCNKSATFFDNPLRVFRAMDLMCRGYKPTIGLVRALEDYLQNGINKKAYINACLQVVHKIFSRLADGEYDVNNVIYAFNYFADLCAWGKMIHPVFEGMKYCIHKNDYHHDSVWQHTMNVIYNMSRYRVLDEHDFPIKTNAYDYWAALLHDAGKTTTISYDFDGNTHFYDHQCSSVRISEEILKESPLNKVWTDFVLELIAHHMDTKVFGDEPIKYRQYKHIRKLQWELGAMGFHHFLILNHADCAASERSENKNTINIVRAVKDMAYNCGESAWECYKIPVSGSDITEAFPDEPGVNIGKYIKQLYKVTFSRPDDYKTKEQCLHYVRTLIKTGWANKACKETK